MDRIRVALVEDDARVRREVRRILTERSDVDLVGAFASAETALEALAEAPPDLMVVDLELPGMDGIALTAAVRAWSDPPEVLMLTAFASAAKVFDAIRAGAAGYLVKRDVASRLLTAIDEVHAGGVVIEPRLARMFWNLFDAERGRSETDPYPLTEVEREVLGYVARGLSNAEVSGVAGRTPRQVKAALESVYRKMGVRSRVEAVVLAVRAGLVEP